MPSRCRTRRRTRRWTPWAICLLPALVEGAFAQDEYRLDEDDEWTLTARIDPTTPEGQLATIRRELAAGEYERAENLASRWIDRFPRDPNLPTAYLYRGDAQKGRENYYEALFDYEYVARMFVGSEAFATALQRELEIAKLFATGTRRKLWGLRIVDATQEAEELLIRIQERLPGSTLAEEAGLALADFYFRRRDMGLAAEAYSLFVENYPRSPHISTARRRLVYAHLASFKGPEFDAAGLYEARVKLRELELVEPATAQQIGAEALLQRIDDSDAQKMLVTARWYAKTGDAIAAELTVRRLLRRYEQTRAAREGLRLVQRIWPELPESVRREAPDYEAYRLGLEEVDGGRAGPEDSD